MKRIYFTALLLFPLLAWGQFRPIYLLEKYEIAKVNFKDGRQVEAVMNYDMDGENFLFLDGDEQRILNGTENIASVYIGERLFFYTSDGLLLERIPLPGGKAYFIRWSAKFKSAGGAYGGSTAIASVEKIAVGEGRYFRVEDKSGDMELKVRYYVMVNGRERNFATTRALARLYRSHEQEILDFAQRENINFAELDDVYKLMEFSAQFMD